MMEDLDESLNETLYELTMKILKTWSEKVLPTWMRVYEKLLDRLTFEGPIHDEAIELVSSFSDLYQPLASRCASVFLLAALAKKVEIEEMESLVIPKISSMCKDFNWEVRRAMGENLEAIFSRLEGKQELCDEYLLDEYLEMVEDEETEVRGHALKHLEHFDKFSREGVTEKVLPVLSRVLCRKPRDSFTDSIVQRLAPILNSVKTYVFDEDSPDAKVIREEVVKLIEEYAESPIVEEFEEIPKHLAIAYNFPGFAVLFGPERFTELLLPIYKKLSKHELTEIRTSLSLSFHEIVKVYAESESGLDPWLNTMFK